MDATTAKAVLIIFTACAAGLWLAGFTFVMLVSRNARHQNEPNETLDFGDDLVDSGNSRSPSFTGTAEVEGSPPELSTRLAAILANWSHPGAITIEERTDTKLRFRSSPGMPGWGISRCEDGTVHFKQTSPNRTLISYLVHYPSRNWLLLAAKLFLVLGLIAIVAGYWALSTYAVTSANPGVRAQVIQMMQTLHFLWPPFLFAVLHRQLRRTAQAQIRATIQNLPYVDPNRPPSNPAYPGRTAY